MWAQKYKQARRELFQLRRIRNTLYKPALVSVYTIYIRLILEYGSLVLSSLSQTSHDRLESLQRRAGRVCLGLPLFEPTHHSSLLHHTSLPTLSSRRQYRQLVFARPLVHGRVPHHLRNTSRPDFAQRSHHDLRRQRTYAIPTTRTTRHRDSRVNNAAHHYNNLPKDLTSIVDALTFKQAIAPLRHLSARVLHTQISTDCSPRKHSDKIKPFHHPHHDFSCILTTHPPPLPPPPPLSHRLLSLQFMKFEFHIKVASVHIT